MTSVGSDDSDFVQRILKWILDVGIDGFGFLPRAEKVAADHLKSTTNVEDAIESIITWRTAQAASTGFVTGLGGLATMPITIPAGLAACYALGANTAAAIAHLRGYDIHSEQVRTIVLLCLIGEAGEQILKAAGIKIGNKLFEKLLSQIPGKVLIEINKKVGFRLITKAGEKGVVNIMKMVPLAGGIIGGTFDGWFVNSCGQIAKKVFVSVKSYKGNLKIDQFLGEATKN